MDILVSPYELKKIGSGEIQEGTLLKIVDNGDFGVADLCPHPALGDRDWLMELKQEGPLFKRALQLANEDLSGRKNKVSLLQNKKIQNNFLLTDFLRADLNEKKYSGQIVKIKGDQRIQELAAFINGVPENVKLRVDFNAKVTTAEFEKFLSLLGAAAISKIEYIEDPTVLGPHWKEWNARVPLASDWQKTFDPALARFRIIKPAREEIPSDCANCIFTSAMDHPVGVAHGLRQAQMLPSRVCGFSTLGIYEATPFNRYFVQDEIWLGFSDLALKDTGIGMSAELNRLSWKSLAEVVG